LSYTTFTWTDPRLNGSSVTAATGTADPAGVASTVAAHPAAGKNPGSGPDAMPAWDSRGQIRVGCTITNTGGRPGTEVVQLYLHDPVAQVARPLTALIGYTRVGLMPGETQAVEFTVHADLTSYTGRDGKRIVEPGEVHLLLSPSSAQAAHTIRLWLTGPARLAGPDRQLITTARVVAAR
jgi:hypothetical protein